MAQRNYLTDNYLQRQLQENLLYAAENGLKKMRYPTPETAANIEGYPKNMPIKNSALDFWNQRKTELYNEMTNKHILTCLVEIPGESFVVIQIVYNRKA